MSNDTPVTLGEKPSFVLETSSLPIQMPTTTALSESKSSALAPILADPAAHEAYSYAKDLGSADRARAMQAAVQLYKQSLSDSNAVITFGDASLKPLNELVKYQLTQVEPVSIPGLKAQMTQFQREMAAINGRYDLKDKNVKKDYENWLNGAHGLFHKAKDFMAMFKADVQTIEKQIDGIETTLAGAQVETYKNVTIYDQIFAKNEEGIDHLRFDLAVMEFYVNYVGQMKPPSQKADGSLMTDHDVDMWKQDQAQRLMIMRTKIANTKGRLGIAWTTSPQARMSQIADFGMLAQLHNLENQAVPLARQMLLSMRMAMASLERAQMAGAVKDLVNNMAKQNADLQLESSTAVMAVASQPIFMPDTITYITAALEKAADGIIAGYAAGEAKHAEIDQALEQQQRVLSSSTEKISGEVLHRIVTKALEAPPKELTTVPMVALTQR